MKPQRRMEDSIPQVMASTGKSREEVLVMLHITQPPVLSIERTKFSRKEIKKAKSELSIPDGLIVKSFGNWSKFKPNWGSFIFNGVRIN